MKALEKMGAKVDYQFYAPVTAWDASGRYAHWRNLPKDQPFFGVFNFNQIHESGLFEPSETLEFEIPNQQ
jgi:hypothetical protein